MQHPVSASLYDSSDPFGSMSGRSYPHTGSDYATAYGEVYAIADMVIYHTGWNDGNGNYICAYVPGHDWDGVEGGLYVAFLHLSSINVDEGAAVKQGQKIGVAGNTGANSRGPHLHITMSNSDLAFLGQGAKIDPWAYIQARLGAPKPPPAPPKPNPTPNPTPIPKPPAGPVEPKKLTPAQKKAAIDKLREYIKAAQKNIVLENRKGANKDIRKIAKYREQIARNKPRIENIRKNGY